MGHLHCDVFNQERFLINGVAMRLRMVRSRDTFCLIDQTERNFENHILDASCQTFKDFRVYYWYTPKLLPKLQQNILSRVLK